MEFRYGLGALGKRVWTREKAREARAQVDGYLDRAQAGDVLIIDAKGVEVFDYSFAAEFFGRLLIRLPTEYPGRFLVVENLGQWTHQNLQAALRDLGLTMIERQSGGTYRLIGKVAEPDRATFEELARAGGLASATDLADRLGVNLTAMNERLAKLVRLGVVRRDDEASSSGRSRYHYSTLA